MNRHFRIAVPERNGTTTLIDVTIATGPMLGTCVFAVEDGAPLGVRHVETGMGGIELSWPAHNGESVRPPVRLYYVETEHPAARLADPASNFWPELWVERVADAASEVA